MIVVKVELHSVITGQVSEIGRMLIANDGTSLTRGRGNYDVKVLRRSQRAVYKTPFDDWRRASVTRTGRVENHPRLSASVWRLVCRALRSAFPEER